MAGLAFISRRVQASLGSATRPHPCPPLPWPWAQGMVNPKDKSSQEGGIKARNWGSPIAWESPGRGACLLLATSFLPGKRLPVIKTQSKRPSSGKLPRTPYQSEPTNRPLSERLQHADCTDTYMKSVLFIECSPRARRGARCLAASTPHWVLCVTYSQGVTSSVLPSSTVRLSRFSRVADGGASSVFWIRKLMALYPSCSGCFSICLPFWLQSSKGQGLCPRGSADPWTNL